MFVEQVCEPLSARSRGQDRIWQGSLLGWGEPEADEQFHGLRRLPLDDASWIDLQPGWLRGADEVCTQLLGAAAWGQRRVTMWGKLVDEPRLTTWWSVEEQPAPLPLLDRLGEVLGRRYGVKFDSIGLNLYRDGRDSVAWHSDRVRQCVAEPTIAIVSVGAPRPFQIRPMGGGPSRTFLVGAGDLLVMGGAFQHEWEHAVPKVAHAQPRISIAYRHGLPGPDDS